MDHETGEEAPPSTDLAGWRRAVGDGSFRAFKMESVVAAIQDLGPSTDKAVMNPLLLHVSDTIIHRLRGLIGRNVSGFFGRVLREKDRAVVNRAP